ncbi:uncharacterized protein B0H64DRAFT_398826 [Chaetomium fimeti]|uniref:Uncharacterized protein n=1 Tax=Chaetomium fimeti TaxID=1854472 RepID=A0AAE0LQ94_9PEZI|nr:hypothetical protein B0H64DRAFT_398826 [Chaetomium fimeti]
MFFSSPFCQFALFYLVYYTPVQAFTVFSPECSQPTTTYNFVSGPDTRGTLEILWSSLFTIFACTWAIQHPNIPEQRDGRYPGWTDDIRWGLKGLWENIKLAFYTVVAPEVIITVATNDLLMAREDCHVINADFEHDNVPWGLSHSFYANMGGFVIRVTKGSSDTLFHHNPYHLVTADLLSLRRNGYLKRLPYMAEEQLLDRSKADPVIKAIAIAQILWSVFQIIVRAFRHLTISLLELATVAFAVCAIIIYILCWKKPKFVQTTITVLEYTDEIPLEVLRLLDADRGTSIVKQFLIPSRFRSSSRRRAESIPGSPVGNQTSQWAQSMRVRSIVTSAVGLGAAAVFGAVHVAGWNFAFPTTVEKVAWQCASLYTTGFVLVAASGFALATFAGRVLGKEGKSVVRLGMSLVMWVYLFARLFILVEIFRTLFFLAPDAHVSTWASDIPHFS